MSTAEFDPAETPPSQINYEYYTDFDRWGGAQIPITLLGTAAGFTGGFSVGMLLHEPYSNFEWKLQALESDRAYQTSEKQIKKDTKEIVYAIKHQPKTIMHKPEIAALTFGGGPVLGALTAVGVLKARRWLHERKVSRVETASNKLRQTFDFVELFDEQFYS